MISGSTGILLGLEALHDWALSRAVKSYRHDKQVGPRQAMSILKKMVEINSILLLVLLNIIC